jgi:hypothetical protein
MLSKPAMGRPVMTRPAINAPMTGIRAEPARAGLRIPSALQPNIEIQRGPHAARLANTRTVPLEGTGKRSVTTTRLPKVAEEGLKLPVRLRVCHRHCGVVLALVDVKGCGASGTAEKMAGKVTKNWGTSG